MMLICRVQTSNMKPGVGMSGGIICPFLKNHKNLFLKIKFGTLLAINIDVFEKQSLILKISDYEKRDALHLQD